MILCFTINFYKIILTTEMSITYTIALFGRNPKKNTRKDLEAGKIMERKKNNSRENSVETTCGQ